MYIQIVTFLLFTPLHAVIFVNDQNRPLQRVLNGLDDNKHPN